MPTWRLNAMTAWLVITAVVLFLLLFLITISILRVGADADRQSEAAFRQMIQQQKEETDAVQKQITL